MRRGFAIKTKKSVPGTSSASSESNLRATPAKEMFCGRCTPASSTGSVLRRGCPKKILPQGIRTRQVFWLVPVATPSRSGGSVALTCRGLATGLTAAGTAADFHGIPFSSVGARGALSEPLRCKFTKLFRIFAAPNQKSTPSYETRIRIPGPGRPGRRHGPVASTHLTLPTLLRV